MFCTPPKTVVARVPHQCTYCGEAINSGDTYFTWKSVDDSWFTNKMHPECADELNEWGDGEYSAYSNDRPKIERPTP